MWSRLLREKTSVAARVDGQPGSERQFSAMEDLMLCYAKLSRTTPQKLDRPAAWTLNRPARGSASAFCEAGGHEESEGRVLAGETAGNLPVAASGGNAVAGLRVETSPESLLEDLRNLIAADPGSARVAALRLANILSPQAPVDSMERRGGLAPWQRRKLDRYLVENLASPLRLKRLAELVNLSVSHFNRSFKESHGVAPHRYIIQLRLKLAQSLMQSTKDSLCDIALACGLTDQAHLTKLFRQHIGQTPNGWRRRHFAGYDTPLGGNSETASQFVGKFHGPLSSNPVRTIVGPQSGTTSRRSWGGRNDADISVQ
jgi:AraC family transcriptional regulator